MNSMTRRLYNILFVFAAVVWLLTAQPANAQSAREDCSNLVANHTYILGFEGFANLSMLNPGAPVVPNAGAGFVTFSPGGNWNEHMTITTGLFGLFEPVPVTDGVYEVSVDTTKDPVLCVGTMIGTAVFGPPFPPPGKVPIHFQLLVAEGGERIEMIHTDPALIVGATGFRVQASGCSNQTIAGKYSDDVKVWVLGQPSGPLSFPPEQLLGGYFPAAFSGAFEFQPGVPPSTADFPDSLPGSGSVVFWDSGSLNGMPFQRTGLGWYKMDPDCTGTTVLKDSLGNPDFHLRIFVDKTGKNLYLVNIDTVTIPGLPAPVPAFILSTPLDLVNRSMDWHQQPSED